MIEEAIKQLTIMYIKQYEKEKKEKEYIKISKSDFIKHHIKVLKEIKKHTK